MTKKRVQVYYSLPNGITGVHELITDSRVILDAGSGQPFDLSGENVVYLNHSLVVMTVIDPIEETAVTGLPEGEVPDGIVIPGGTFDRVRAAEPGVQD